MLERWRQIAIPRQMFSDRMTESERQIREGSHRIQRQGTDWSGFNGVPFGLTPNQPPMSNGISSRSAFF